MCAFSSPKGQVRCDLYAEMGESHGQPHGINSVIMARGLGLGCEASGADRFPPTDSIASSLSQGHMSGLLGNLILFSYFAAKREWGATAVHAVGVASTSVLLAQVPSPLSSPPCMPS